MTQARKKRESEFARRLIIESATSVFARKGAHGATMEEIARAAGYSPAAVYKYFGNKEQVFLEVLSAIGDGFLALFDEPQPPGLSFEQRLRWLLTRQNALAARNRDFFLAFLTQRGCFEWDLHTELGDEATEHYREYLARMTAFMAEGVAEGALRDVEPADAASALVGVTNAFGFRWLTGGTEQPIDVYLDTIVELFLYGAASGRREEKA